MCNSSVTMHSVFKCRSEQRCSNKWTHHVNNNMDFDDIDDNEDEDSAL